MKQPSDFSVHEWLAHLENRHQNEIQLGLSRVKKIAEPLGLLNMNATVITVAGTNGKGSTIAALEAIYGAAGYQVAAYTSPHLLYFNERIRINQTAISDQLLINAFLAVHATPGSETLTYFEMVTLAALWHFKQLSPDVILLEVGMGGRLDATNCIDADLAIITTIDLDHEVFLGSTREAIAIEKAGIFRQNQPAIYADLNPPHTLIEQAEKNHVPLSKLHEAYTFNMNQNSFCFSSFSPTPCKLQLSHPHIHHQAFAAAIMATLKLQPILPVSESNYEHAAKTVTILGRGQWLKTPIPTYVDVAHNSQSVNLLAEKIKKNPPKGQVHAIFSGLEDKTLYALLEPMRAYVNKWYLTSLDSARGASQASLKAAFSHAIDKQPLTVFNEPLAAYTAAVNAVKPGDVIVVYGSFLLVSAVMLAYLNKGEKNEHSN